MEPFLGATGLRSLPILLDGSQGYEVKGTVYWVDQMDTFGQRNLFLQNLYMKKLDEKRNFWSFVLTIVSIVQFPITALAGYWCMHVDDLFELQVDWWPEVIFSCCS